MHEIRDAARAKSLGLSPDGLYLLVHSGSRSLGSAIQDTVGSTRLRVSDGSAAEYLAAHDAGVKWARWNRALIAKQVCSHIRAEAGFLSPREDSECGDDGSSGDVAGGDVADAPSFDGAAATGPAAACAGDRVEGTSSKLMANTAPNRAL